MINLAGEIKMKSKHRILKLLVSISVIGIFGGIAETNPINAMNPQTVKAKEKEKYVLTFYPDYQVIHGSFKNESSNSNDYKYIKFLVSGLKRRGYKFNSNFSEGKWHKHNSKLDKKETKKLAFKVKKTRIANTTEKEKLIGKRLKTIPKKLRGQWGGPQAFQWTINKKRMNRTEHVYKQEKKDIYVVPTSSNSGYRFWVKSIKYKSRKYRVLVYQKYKFVPQASNNTFVYELYSKNCYLSEEAAKSRNLIWKNIKYPNINMVFSTWFQGNRHKLRLSYKDAIRISEGWIISY